MIKLKYQIIKLPELFCADCVNKKICKPPYCPPVTYINGRTASKEALVSDIMDESNPREYRDYNEVISELIEDKRIKGKSDLERIFQIKSKIKRAIAILIKVGLFSIADVSRLMNLSDRQIYRLIK